MLYKKVRRHGSKHCREWLGAILVALEMAAIALPAKAAEKSDCPVPSGGIKVTLPSGMPPALLDKMGDTALPGQPFNAIDVYVKGLPNRRYIFVWNIGSKWFVATEQGGIALRGAIYTYDLGKDGKTATLIDTRFTLPSSVCAVAIKLAGR